jgi:hypothetical protein
MDIYNLGVDGILLHKNRIFVPNVQDLKCIIFHEMHNVPYARHPRYQKTCSNSQEPILLSGYEEIDSRIHRKMYGMPES